MNQVSRRGFIKNAGGASIALWLGLSNKTFYNAHAVEILSFDFSLFFIPKRGYQC